MQKLNADETKELEDAMGKFKVGEPIDTTGLTPKIIAFIRTNELTKSDFAGTFLSQDGKKFKELGTLKKYRRWHNRKTFWKHRKDEAFWVLFFASIISAYFSIPYFNKQWKEKSNKTDDSKDTMKQEKKDTQKHFLLFDSSLIRGDKNHAKSDSTLTK